MTNTIDLTAIMRKVVIAFELWNTDGWDQDLEDQLINDFVESDHHQQTTESFADYLIDKLALWELDGFEREILMDVINK